MFENKKIGFGITASFCTIRDVLGPLRALARENAEIFPFVTHNVYNCDSRFHKKDEFLREVEDITGHTVVHTIAEAETFGPDRPLDLMIVAPITGNSLAKLSAGITDNAVLMASKTTLRNRRPVVLAPFTNDALGLNGVNIMKLFNVKNIYFVPFGQDNPQKKPTSMTSDLGRLLETAEKALLGEQIQPVIIEIKK